MHVNLQLNSINETIVSNKQTRTPNLQMRSTQQSYQSLHKIHKYYKEFQRALYVLQASVEELSCLEIEQLRYYETMLKSSSKITFDLQVPSNCPCQGVLPIAGESRCSKNDVTSSVNSLIILPADPITSAYEKNILDKIEMPDKMFPTIYFKQKSTNKLLSITKKRKCYGFDGKFTKCRTKKVLLNLSFRFSKHFD
ncbi:unnamed protein product [Rotaria magnacalcarata]|uniref:Uncharacterized protein n=1 Tax=Rotaria magnacalcarata TaxID=392030 RepID=A0A814XES9_9BILA|nr:unnamed protein product [Rotaria magnacalcarata]CAF4293145.1 unnamed protein product [Rotaria magnacalcarata]